MPACGVAWAWLVQWFHQHPKRCVGYKVAAKPLESELQGWSVKDLKRFCEQHGVSHSHCVEKSELVKLATSVRSDSSSGNTSAKQRSTASEVCVGSGSKGVSSGSSSSGNTVAKHDSAPGARAAASDRSGSGINGVNPGRSKAQVDWAKVQAGARQYEKYAAAARALGINDVGARDEVRARHCLLSPEVPTSHYAALILQCRHLWHA